MEKNEVSLHEVKVYRLFAANPERWISNREVAAEAHVAQRTARAHTLKLVNLGLLDQAEVFPSHRFRFSETASKRNKTYTQRLDHAASVFGL